MVKEEKIDSNNYKNIRKSENKKVKILVESKSRNLLKSRLRNFSRSKKVQTINTTKEINFRIPSTRMAFTKLRQTFT